VRQQDAYPTSTRVQVKLHCVPKMWSHVFWNTVYVQNPAAPFSKATLPSLAACTYLGLFDEGIENYISARSPNITSAYCDLDFWPPDPEVDRSCPCPGEDVCQFALKSVHLFSKYIVHKLITDKRTNRRTDGQVDNIMCPDSLDWRADKYSVCSLSILLGSCVFITLSAFCPR